MLIIATW